MKLVWLPSALSDLERLKAFLEQRGDANPAEAAALIADAARSLEQFPERCRRVPGRNEFRELFVEARSQIYVLQFRVKGQFVVVVRVWHGKEQR